MNKKTTKIALIAINALIFISFGLSKAQSFKVIYSDDNYSQCLCDYINVSTTAWVKNISGSNKDIMVRRVAVNIPAEHETNFCWVQCYGSATSVSPEAITAKPGDTVKKLLNDISTDSVEGSGSVKYCFFDKDNEADSACVVLSYRVYNPTGISSLHPVVSKIYPNPSSTEALVSFNIHAEAVEVLDINGRVLRHENLAGNSSSYLLNTRDLKNGIYLVKVIANNAYSKPVSLVVSR